MGVRSLTIATHEFVVPRSMPTTICFFLATCSVSAPPLPFGAYQIRAAICGICVAISSSARSMYSVAVAPGRRSSLLRAMAFIALLSGGVGSGVGGVACGAGGGAAPTPTAPIAQGRCPGDAFCFNVLAGAPGPLGAVHVRLIWVRPDEKHESTPDVVELGTLTGRERSFAVPRSMLRPPRQIGSYGVTWGYVIAAPANAGGAPSSPKDAVGIAQMMFTHAIPEVTALSFNDLYPAGLAPGIAAYRMARVEGRTHEKFFLAPNGAVFDLLLCPTTQPKCRLPAPNPN